MEVWKTVPAGGPLLMRCGLMAFLRRVSFCSAKAAVAKRSPGTVSSHGAGTLATFTPFIAVLEHGHGFN